MNSLIRFFAGVLVLGASLVPVTGAGEILFDFSYDASFTTAAGANEAAAQADFAFVGSYLSSVIKSSVESPITMTFTISGSNQPSSNTLGSAGSSFWGNDNLFNKTATQLLAQTGSNPAGAGSPVGVANFNFGQSWGFNGIVSGSEYDFRYVLLHEMTHAMGFIGSIDSTGETQFGSGFYGWMDQYFYGYNGSSYEPLVQTSGSNLVAMTGAAAAVVDNTNPVQFRGPNVMAYLGNNPQAMYTPSTFEDGSSLYHVDILNDLMYYATDTGAKTVAYSDLHLAFLKDLGYTVVPEPGSYVLAMGCVIVLGFFGRSRANRQHS